MEKKARDAWQRYLRCKRRRKKQARVGNKRAKHAEADVTPVQLWHDLRMVQRKSACSTATIFAAAKAMFPKFNSKAMFEADNELMKRGGTVCLELHGCVHCNDHVFLPSSRSRRCPKCRGARYNSKNRPNEVCHYFPLRAQLDQLLSLPTFRTLLKHEYERPANSAYMTDVYDAPMWRERFGATPSRIVLQLCVDGIPAFAVKHSMSLKPLVLMMLNLPHKLRVQAANMLLLMLIPAHLKGKAARKYYDFAADFELNSLHDRGVHGWKVMLYGNSLDTPGRAELLNMQVVCLSIKVFIIYLIKQLIYFLNNFITN